MCECYADEIRREIEEQECKATVADLLKVLELATGTPASVVKVVAVIVPIKRGINVDILHLTGWMIRSDSKLLNWLWLQLARWLYGREEQKRDEDYN